MSRAEFSQKTKDKAWERAGGRCEAEGELYGLPPGVRCNVDLMLSGVEYDHRDPDKNSRDSSLANCVCACPKDHRWKTSNRDRPLIAKTDHQQRKARGNEKPFKQKITPHVDPWGKNRIKTSRDIHEDI